jgi:hypothetical protein
MTVRLKRLFKFKIILLASFVLSLSSPVDAQQRAQGKQKEAGPEQLMSGIYAEHLATSICKSSYGSKFRVSSLSTEEKRQFNEHMNGSCKCLYEKTVEKSSPDMVLDYIMYMYGAQKDPKKPAQDQLNYIRSQSFNTVGAVFESPDVRKKCGFIK